MEEEAGLVGGAEEGLGHLGAAEPVDHRARLQGAAADLQVVVDGLRGEVQELQVDSFMEEKKRKAAMREKLQPLRSFGCIILKRPSCMSLGIRIFREATFV